MTCEVDSIKNKFEGKAVLIDWLVVPIIGGSLISLFFCPDCLSERDYGELIKEAILSAIFWALLANGNSYLVNVLDKKWSWIQFPVKRFVYSLIATLVYTVAISLLVIYVYVEFYLGVDFMKIMDNNGWWGILQTPIFITFGISIFLHGRGFLYEWRESALNVEKLKNENLSAKFESLKNQVNPHFLFNSLNALSSLVYADQKKATDFIQKLSEVYRYVLDHQNDELVDLKSEIGFVKSFVYLNKIRFGENLKVEFDGFDSIDYQKSLPPLALQMLVENAVKHNEISKEFPLTISLIHKEDRLLVTNNLNHLHVPKRDSNGLGLSNIISRYGYLSSEKVNIDHNTEDFSVSIPLLNMNGS